jgi:hypothetical protein
MEIEGTVHNGVVVTEAPLPEGTRVTVTPHEPTASVPSHYDLFREVIGQALGLPIITFAADRNNDACVCRHLLLPGSREP